MNWLTTFLKVTIAAAALFFTGCAASGPGASSGVANSSKEVSVDNPNIDLTNYLRRVPGVTVTGSGPNARITIRGVNTFMGDPSPLFVLDGVKMGRNFQAVYSRINMHDVTSIEVLKGADASLYGVEGGSGVILIKYQ